MNTATGLVQKFEELLEPLYPADQPGAAIIVVRDGDVLFRKGYGMANLELGVSIEPHMVFRLGSITKQFTAVCILMLMEQGKLSLQDDLARFLPDYPTGGRTITIEHLLTHTSGIKSYTDMPEWLPLWRRDMAADEIIDLFKDQPFEFEPGENFKYNNSGYILLGAIIEKTSGMKYAEFVQKNIFEPLRMIHSLYDETERIVPGRVAGYSKGTDGFVNAAYVSMSQPYAAGSLASSVDDLALWEAALNANKLLRRETLALAFKPGMLNNGVETGYGYGWLVFEHEGFQFIQHNGGIHGFTANGVRVPAEKVYVAVLTNSDAPETPPSTVASKLAALAIGHPIVEPEHIELFEDALDEYVAVYQISENEERMITRQGTQMYSQRNGGVRIEIYPIAIDTFSVNKTTDRFVFTRNENGKINGMQVLRRLGPPERYLRTEKPLKKTN